MSRASKNGHRSRGASRSRPSTLALVLGGRRKREDKGKAREEGRKRESARRAKARETVDYIGYDAMFKDGIAQVAPGLFSETLEFSDISYQSARKESQERIFTVLSGVYNYFNADTSVQLTIANVPIPQHLIGNKEFFRKAGGPTDALVDEYNRILNDKMREGVSNLERHRWLTYAVPADDAETAVPKLAHIRTDVTASLNRIRCEVSRLDGHGAAARRRLANPSVQALRVRLGQTVPVPRDAHEGPRRAKPPRLRAGGARRLLRVRRSVRQRPRDPRLRRGAGGRLHRLDNRFAHPAVGDHPPLPDEPVRGARHGEAPDGLDGQGGAIDEQMSAVKKGYDYSILPPELRYSKEEAEELLDFLRNKNERLFRYTGLVYTYAALLEELDRQVDQVVSVAQGNSLGIVGLDYRQKQALNSVLPLGMNHLDAARFLTTGQVAMQMPFASQELNQQGGGYYGQSKQSGNLVICNRKLLASPMGFECGMPGSGKSFSVKRRDHQHGARVPRGRGRISSTPPASTGRSWTPWAARTSASRRTPTST